MGKSWGGRYELTVIKAKSRSGPIYWDMVDSAGRIVMAKSDDLQEDRHLWGFVYLYRHRQLRHRQQHRTQRLPNPRSTNRAKTNDYRSSTIRYSTADAVSTSHSPEDN